jgi:hypothetical protein
LYNYPKTATHPAFTISLSTNFVDGSGGESGIRFVGSEGTMTIMGDNVKLTQRGVDEPSEKDVIEGYNSVNTFSKDMREKFAEQYRAEKAKNPNRPRLAGSSEYKAPEGYDDRLDHFHNFFNAIRAGKSVTEDALFGFRAAAPALLTNNSHLEKRVIEWDAENMKVGS